MKKKVYFIIVSILQIILAVYTIVMAGSIVQTQLDTLSQTEEILPIDYIERTKTMLENGGELLIRVSGVICLILNALILKVACKDNILKKKRKLITFSAICFFMGEIDIIGTLAIVNIIILLFAKRKNPEDYPEKMKKEIPPVEYEKSTKKEKIFGSILVLAYFGLPILIGILIGVLNLNSSIPENIILLAQVVLDIIMIILAILCFKDKLKKDLKTFKENAKSYFQYVLPKIGIMYAIYLIASMVCTVASGQGTSENQQILETLPEWYLIFGAIIYAPIVEELIFRGVLRRFIKNNTIFVIASGIIFGLLHSIGEATVTNLIIMGIPYAILGSTFAYIYAKTNNLTNNIAAHAFHNTIATILSFIIM